MKGHQSEQMIEGTETKRPIYLKKKKRCMAVHNVVMTLIECQCQNLIKFCLPLYFMWLRFFLTNIDKTVWHVIEMCEMYHGFPPYSTAGALVLTVFVQCSMSPSLVM